MVKMLELEVIEPVQAEELPVAFAHKTNGKIQFLRTAGMSMQFQCVNRTALYEWTGEEIPCEMQRSLSRLDDKSSYWKVENAKGDRENRVHIT